MAKDKQRLVNPIPNIPIIMDEGDLPVITEVELKSVRAETGWGLTCIDCSEVIERSLSPKCVVMGDPGISGIKFHLSCFLDIFEELEESIDNFCGYRQTKKSIEQRKKIMKQSIYKTKFEIERNAELKRIVFSEKV